MCLVLLQVDMPWLVDMHGRRALFWRETEEEWVGVGKRRRWGGTGGRGRRGKLWSRCKINKLMKKIRLNKPQGASLWAAPFHGLSSCLQVPVLASSNDGLWWRSGSQINTFLPNLLLCYGVHSPSIESLTKTISKKLSERNKAVWSSEALRNHRHHALVQHKQW